MTTELEDEELIEKAELIMAVRGYEEEERHKWEKGMDLVATLPSSSEEILLRVMTDPESRSGAVGVDVVREAIETMKQGEYEKSILISRRFTEAAKKELRQEGVQMVSEEIPPRFKPERLYLAMQKYIDDLCQAKCGCIPKQESDCKGRDPEGHFSCQIRLISDNASLHFERGWKNLLQRDFERLIKINNSTNDDEAA
jgi:hypothetical protein